MTGPHGPEDGFDVDELAGYLEELEDGVDAHVTEPRLLGLRAQALNTVGHGSVATPVPPAHPWAANPHAQTPDSWPGGRSPLPPPPPLPVPPIPAPPLPLPLPSPLPMPPLPTEPVPAPQSPTPTWCEPENGGPDTGGPRGVSKRQR